MSNIELLHSHFDSFCYKTLPGTTKTTDFDSFCYKTLPGTTETTDFDSFSIVKLKNSNADV